VIPAGDARPKGYVAAAFFNVFRERYPVVNEIEKFVLRQGQGEKMRTRARRRPASTITYTPRRSSFVGIVTT